MNICVYIYIYIYIYGGGGARPWSSGVEVHMKLPFGSSASTHALPRIFPGSPRISFQNERIRQRKH